MKKLTILASVAAAVLLVASCASTPPQKPTTEPVQPEAVQPEQAVVPAPETERAQARALKDRIDTNGLADYDPENYQTASTDLQTGESAYGTDNAAAKRALDSAIEGFNAVITKGGPLHVAALQETTVASKKAADDLLAAVAVKDQYAQADEVYQRALKEKESEDLDSAARDMSSAAGLFDAVAATAKQKKDAALLAVDAAQKDLGTSEEKAADAEKSLADEGIAASGATQ
jgi:hypothetical protein